LIDVVSVVVLGFWLSMVYYPHMPSIVGKRRGKRTYYYLVESARVDGQPRIVSQQYLGTAEEVMARLQGAATGEPARSQHKQFGDLAAVWSMLERLDVAGVVDQAVPRYANAAASVGTYIALAIANRIVDPCSKRGLRTGGPPPPGRGGSSSARPPWTTGGSGTRWTAWGRRTCAGSRPSWGGGWWPSSGWTLRGWCWT
jgi:hypothetical protein